MIINLDGQPTYFMTLKDNAGLIKQYAFMCPVVNYTSVGTGETHRQRPARLPSGARQHRGILTGQSSKSVTGKVLRIAPESIGESVTYKIILRANLP